MTRSAENGTDRGGSGRRAAVPATEHGATVREQRPPEAAGREPAPSPSTAREGSWAQVEAEAPELAAAVRASFAVRKHCTMATLRADGSPRISGTEVQWEDGDLWVGSMPGALKARDLQRDGRLAVHSPTVDPPEGDETSWAGEAKVAGRAVEVGGDDEVGGDPEVGGAPGEQGASHRFRIDPSEVVHTRVSPAGDGLVIRSWHVGRGAAVRTRVG